MDHRPLRRNFDAQKIVYFSDRKNRMFEYGIDWMYHHQWQLIDRDDQFPRKNTDDIHSIDMTRNFIPIFGEDFEMNSEHYVVDW